MPEGVTIKNCIKQIENNFSCKDQELIKSALNFARNAHSGQTRKSGEAFIVHPISTAKRSCIKFKDTALTAAALLHDVVEDCDEICIKDIYDKFGDEIGFLVDAVTKDFKSFYLYPEISFDDKIERLIWAGLKDIRVFLLKLADRENNLETLKYLKENKQVRMAFETQAIFEPLKKILSYDKPLSLEKTETKLMNTLKRNKINSPSEFKTFLYKKSFKNINHEIFNLIYRNSSSIIWRIEGIDMYKKLCSTRAFKNKIQVISVKSNGKWLTADFKFKSG
ncbi:MAG: HD domain-containing protein, partial [Nanoarchaeota archaeon]|nr:HD domain-containing protein [Nanoarchaeota archaeon]